ncbi:MAG: hypothetical protein WCL04_06150 [Verrucomicrobiota bacterium]
MTKLCIFAGMTAGGIAGSMLGEVFGWGMLDIGSFLLSGVGSIVGVVVGWKLAQRLNE